MSIFSFLEVVESKFVKIDYMHMRKPNMAEIQYSSQDGI